MFNDFFCPPFPNKNLHLHHFPYHFWLAHTCLCAVTITNVSKHLCEEVTLTWLLLDHLAWRFVFVLNSRSWLILVQVPSSYLRDLKFFTPPPLTFISSMFHFLYTYSYYTFTFWTGILWAKESPSILPTRIDSCPPFQIFGMEGHLISIPSCHSGTYSHQALPFGSKTKILDLRFLKRILSPWEDSNTSDGGHELKIQPMS